MHSRLNNNTIRFCVCFEILNSSFMNNSTLLFYKTNNIFQPFTHIEQLPKIVALLLVNNNYFNLIGCIKVTQPTSQFFVSCTSCSTCVFIAVNVFFVCRS